MKIAVTYENGNIFQHFGHTAQFKVYEVENGKVVESYVVDTNGSGHGALGGFLFGQGVDVLICGGIGGGAQMALATIGVQLRAGVSGSADEAVAAYLAGSLAYAEGATCSHHHDHGGHDCSDHDCSDHHCGGGCH
jgi:predicted Fe-Mo cluster-binding NifX family protein